MENKTTILGVMSGSSLDGLDLCIVCFEKKADRWAYEITYCETVEIPDFYLRQLEKAPTLDSVDLLELDMSYGRWIGEHILKLKYPIDLISIHGHTVFHLPEKQLSLQIGNGEIINQLTDVTTVTNFRNLDILLGGQGAPLVPMGEKHLFPEFDGFINLGGICNASFSSNSNWLAGDIGPCNQVFNFYSETLGYSFDDGGQMASTGNLNKALLDNWSAFDFFHCPFPKSLGNHWVKEHFLQSSDYESKDVLRTFSFFIAKQILEVLNRYRPKKVMITGGGAYNTFLINQIRNQTNIELVVPDERLINYKEALIFAFLGLLKVRGEANVISGCTGASRDSCSGVVYST